jgi:N-acetylglucosamine kinase-like BadF-type ATPase
MMDCNINFAKNLKELRKMENLSQFELGQKIGYTEKAISKWERGIYIPDIKVLIALSKVFNVTLDELVSKDDSIYFLGIDGGGTKTAFVLEDENGKCVKKYVDIGCNPNDIGIEKAKEILKTGIEKICAGISYSQIAVFAGIAGGGVEQNKNQFQDFLSEYGFLMANVGSDIENIIATGFDGKDGIAMILGTGVVLFCVKGNRTKKMLGWGHYFDEGGSAFNLGRDALSRTFNVVDGIYEETILSKMVLDKANCSIDDLLSKTYTMGKKYVAGFAECVFNAAKKGDKIAENIIRKNMAVVAEALKHGAEYIGKTQLEVVIAGGLTNESNLIPYLQNEIEENYKFKFRILNEEPVCGAVKLSRKNFEAELSKKLRD